MNNLAPLPLDTALQVAQEQNIILRRTPRSIALWAANKKVPGPLRQALKEYRKEIRSMIAEHRKETCPNPQLHRHSWRYAGDQIYHCELCKQLNIV